MQESELAGANLAYEAGSTVDAGPWSVSEDGRQIESEDFTHDVTLRVSGDFVNDTQRRVYSEALALLLNSAGN